MFHSSYEVEEGDDDLGAHRVVEWQWFSTLQSYFFKTTLLCEAVVVERSRVHLHGKNEGKGFRREKKKCLEKGCLIRVVSHQGLHCGFRCLVHCVTDNLIIYAVVKQTNKQRIRPKYGLCALAWKWLYVSIFAFHIGSGSVFSPVEEAVYNGLSILFSVLF